MDKDGTSRSAMRAEQLRPCLRLLLARGGVGGGAGQTTTTTTTTTRGLHKTRPPPTVPAPRPFVPDVQTFLTLIGRGMNKHTAKFPTWESLFSLTSPELKALGVEPARSRRYLLQWLDRYRAGDLGPGGDFQHVRDGLALLKVALPPASVPSSARWVVNVPLERGEAAAATATAETAAAAAAETTTTAAAGTTAATPLPPKVVRPGGYVVRGLRTIVGPYATQLPGSGGATVKVREGMWEFRRGRKIDGGERRRTEIRFKRRSAERREEREAEAGFGAV
ncbi:hypothetical protein CDD83_2250 [Cordyceps sp. RAO-2017]|nr:hypothetical protein CDD83_2250 [Cordyceps sp. RAO-2017]